jgi:hypothetical protein
VRRQDRALAFGAVHGAGVGVVLVVFLLPPPVLIGPRDRFGRNRCALRTAADN